MQESMNILFTALMGMVQGLTEFLPVSSSGHLSIAENLLGLLGYQGGDMRIAFYAMLHLGTLIAVAAVFFKDWVDMLAHPIRNKTLLLLVIASVPALLIKVLLGDTLDELFRGGFLGISFLITAFFLLMIQWTERGRREHMRRGQVTPKIALVMGVFQGIALLPGVSRSGSTLLGGIAGGLKRESAVKFAFMMSAPAILGGLLIEGKEAADLYGLQALISGEILLGVAVSAVFGFLAIRFMLYIIKRVSFYYFALYVVLVGFAVLIMQMTGFANFPPIALPGVPVPLG